MRLKHSKLSENRLSGCASTSSPGLPLELLPNWLVSTRIRPRFSTIVCERSWRHASKMKALCKARSRSTRAILAASAKVCEGAAVQEGGVFGILKRGGRVYTKMIPNVARATLMPIIKAKIELDFIVYTDTFVTYDSLDVSGFHHHRINHRKAFASAGSNHINGIENFWNQAKRHLRKYNGIPKHHFHLFLKECEWRFNYGPPSKLLKTLKSWIKLQNS